MQHKRALSSSSAFTLIELLVVIAIIAILAVVVVLTLNPAQLLAQSRDATRVSDMATLNSAIGLYQTDTGGIGTMGTSSIAYVSLPDSSSTCGTWGLASGSSCVTSTSSKNIDSTGWIPLNFKNISEGAPFSSLPIDPSNTSSSGLFYTYSTNNGQFELISPMESSKYKQSTTGALGPGIATQGSGAGAPPVGYWPMDEGVGSTTQDMSGNGNDGTWYGTPTGTNGTYYSPGKVGPWAGAFDGTSTYLNGGQNILNSQSVGTITAWIKIPSLLSSTVGGSILGLGSDSGYNSLWYFGLYGLNATSTRIRVGYNAPSTNYVYGSTSLNINTWYSVVLTGDGSLWKLYLNGVSETLTASPGSNTGAWWNIAVSGNMRYTIGNLRRSTGDMAFFSGLIDDVRIYNRALSPAEIQAMYNVGK
jgi:prepilin-type N-terminal cleavage/methylation domain-containing protein